MSPNLKENAQKTDVVHVDISRDNFDSIIESFLRSMGVIPDDQDVTYMEFPTKFERDGKKFVTVVYKLGKDDRQAEFSW